MSDLRISRADLSRLERAERGLTAVQRTFRSDLIGRGGLLGDIESAVSLLLRNSEQVARFLRLDENGKATGFGRPELRNLLEEIQGGLSGAVRFGLTGAKLGAFLAGPAGALFGGLAGSISGGVLGASEGAAQAERRRKLARIQAEASNQLFLIQQDYDRNLISVDKLDDMRKATEALDVERQRRAAARERALGPVRLFE